MIERFKLWLSTKSLAFKLIASNVVCVSIGFAVLASFIFSRSEQMIRAQIEENAQRMTQLYATDVLNLFDDTEQTVLNAKNALIQISEKNEKTIQMLLSAALNTTEHSDLNFTDAWVYVFASEDVSKGTLFLETAKNNLAIDFKKIHIDDFYQKFPWFNEVPKEEKIYWSEPYLDQTSGKTVVSCLFPFKFSESEQFNGLIALSVDLTNITKDMESFSMQDYGRLLLLSRDGLYVSHPDPKISLKKTIFDLSKKLRLPVLSKVGNDLKEGKSGIVEIPYSSVVRGEAIFFYAPIVKNKWGVCLVYSKKRLFQPIHEFLMAAGLAIAIGMAVLLLFINFICRKSTNQLLLLSRIAAKYSAGDFSSHFEVPPSSKEINALSKAISDMRINILHFIEREKNTASEQQRIQSEMDIARRIQKATMSANLPESKAFRINHLMLPAKKVSGDFYDFFFIEENRFAFVVADVSGKDVPAALYMMKTQALIKNIARSEKSLADVFARVNNELYEGNESCMFVSAFMGVINIKTGELEFVNAGHPHPFLDVGKGYQLMNITNNIVLGVRKDFVFKVEKLKLKKNNRLFIYTDGVTEAENKKASFYSEDRLAEVLLKESPDTLKTVMQSIKLFAAGYSQSDDITMLEFVFLGEEEKMFSIEPEISKLGDVLDFVSQDMQNRNILEQKRFNMIMACEEIFSNIALYASAVNEIEILTNIEDGYYTVVFKDDGKKYNPLTRENPNIDIPLEERDVGGLGIFIVKKVADIFKYTYKNKKNILTIGIKI